MPGVRQDHEDSEERGERRHRTSPYVFAVGLKHESPCPPGYRNLTGTTRGQLIFLGEFCDWTA